MHGLFVRKVTEPGGGKSSLAVSSIHLKNVVQYYSLSFCKCTFPRAPAHEELAMGCLSTS